MKLLTLLSFLMLTGSIQAQTLHPRLTQQVSFPEQLPAGNYSGITYLGHDNYAVVSDKGRAGFYTLHIDINSRTGEISKVDRVRFVEMTGRNADFEDIAYVPEDKNLWVASEQKSEIFEVKADGSLTGRHLPLPKVFRQASKALGIEALTYDSHNRLFWTVNEGPLNGDGETAKPGTRVKQKLRLTSTAPNRTPTQYLYVMDEPTASEKGSKYAMGVSAVTAINATQLLVLEREFYVPETRLGAFVKCKLFLVKPDTRSVISSSLTQTEPLHKTLVCQWSTKLGLLNFSLANYEGMCLGPTLNDGSQVIVLIADSQNQYSGVLQDWLKTIVLRP